ncbi:ATP synthase F0 subcomplex A subunit [Arcticibacter pallidicorallinus]|uniref:ATP synthase subunit a n=1 Tax=Arcticibacter pallidicorallinus TaxID=1259464 RepID=A0A2T0U6K8_9SPHI|nr:F0F1 ATP synthase subunit A [Arcticibacter pallidicorallinus]PRY53556.1 ATP synthase F0 subcomplex A subunit [Arcticibacter pallidicorallinus]
MISTRILSSGKVRLFVVCAFFFTLFSISPSLVAQHHTSDSAASSTVESDSHIPGVEHVENSHGEEKFDPTKAIMEHIADSHYWHLWGHTSLPLPVIIITDKGVEAFSSAKFHHGEDAYEGTHYTYKLIEDKLFVVDAQGNVDKEASSKIYDFSITKNIASLWIAVIVLILIFTSVSSSYKKRQGKAPKGLQSVIEPFIMFVRDDIAIPNIGYKYAKFMPLLLTMFFFIWINNLLGLIPIFPGGANVTGNIFLTFVLSFIVLLVVNLNGNKYYWKHILLPDVPWWLYPIMIPVELIGVISKPFALMIRLYANISAGHIIILSLISLIFIFKSLAIAPVSVAFVLFMNVLELLVAFLQAFIFTMLTALFIGTAVDEHHH